MIRQDDVIIMHPDGYCTGTENNFYIKTEGLEPVGQKVLYDATICPNAMLENIYVGQNGEVDFLDESFTSNGRAVVYRNKMVYIDEDIDLPHVDIVVFITRRKDVVPPIARLTPAQAAAFFVLGESIETSAGDPSQAGKSKRVVGTNPFIVGPEGDEGNIFFDIVRKNPKVECFVMNTGKVGGDAGEKVTITDSVELIKQIAKGGIAWEKDPFWGYELAKNVPGIDMKKFDPHRFYSEEEIHAFNEKMKEERIAWFAKFPELYPEIPESIGCGKR
jgi:phosphoenolpyruvate carboxykinase (ATP)